MSHLPQRRRDISPPTNTADQDVSIGWLVLAGALVCPNYLEQLRKAAWPEGEVPPRVQYIALDAPVPCGADGSQNGHDARAVEAGESLRVEDNADEGTRCSVLHSRDACARAMFRHNRDAQEQPVAVK